MMPKLIMKGHLHYLKVLYLYMLTTASKYLHTPLRVVFDTVTKQAFTETNHDSVDKDFINGK